MTTAEIAQEQLAQLEEDGFLHLPGVIRPSVLDAVEAEYEQILDRLAGELLPTAEAQHVLQEATFSDRLIALARLVDRPLIPHFEISYPFVGIDKLTPISLGDAVFALITCTEILDAVESVLGPEIASNPVQHARIKFPASEAAAIERNGAMSARTGWHQDLAAVLPDADATAEITVWAAMTDADEKSGCLVYLPGSHRTGLAFHCQPTNMVNRGGSNIPSEYIYEPQAVPVPVKRGDIIMHTMLTKHSSLDNVSPRIRWSFDLRYQRTGQPSGRPVFPAVPVRSAADLTGIVQDPQVWRERWYAARDDIASQVEPPVFNRWNIDSPFC